VRQWLSPQGYRWLSVEAPGRFGRPTRGWLQG
jgi:hypothetical protein